MAMWWIWLAVACLFSKTGATVYDDDYETYTKAYDYKTAGESKKIVTFAIYGSCYNLYIPTYNSRQFQDIVSTTSNRLLFTLSHESIVYSFCLFT